MPNCFAIEDLIPVIDPTAYVHPTAVLIGDVIVGPRCYVGPAACLRGDFGRIIVRDGANVQDTCVIHGFPDSDTIIEVDGHIGHGSVIHGAHIGRNAMVGMNAVVMDRSEIGESSIVGAMAFVREGTIIPPRSLALGIPARVVRQLTDAGNRLEADRHAAISGTRRPQPGEPARRSSRCARCSPTGRASRATVRTSRLARSRRPRA